MKRTKTYQQDNPLYLVATPIGNLKEISTRAMDVLTNADVIACEDTRNTKNLLSMYNIKFPRMLSLREHNEVMMSEKIIELIKEGQKVCYVSDAGYPAISDPGKILVQKVREAGLSVTTISGSNAFLTALTASSLASDHFYFFGFLNAVDNKARNELESLKNITATLLFYESPHRIKRTLNLILEVLGNRKVSLARELTKINEEFIEGTLEELVQVDESTIIGEIVIVVEGAKENESSIDDNAIIKRGKELLKKNMSTRDVSDILAYEFKVNKNYVYKLLIERGKD